MMADPYRYFRVEARDLLDQMGKGLLDLERDGARADVVPRLLRMAHTLKGAARVVKQREIADLAHATEDALEPFRAGTDAVPPGRIAEMLKLLDAMDGRVGTLGAEPKPATPQAAPEEPLAGTRADAGERDALVDGVAEVHVKLASLRRGFGSIERARRLAELLVAEVSSARARRPADGASHPMRSLAEELSTVLEGLERSLPLGVEQVDRELRQVHEMAERLRLLPASAIFNPLERAARDVAESLNKRVSFEAQGGDVRLDPRVLATIRNALVQIVVNAVAHGIETEAERAAAGKPREGRISLAVERRQNRIAFVCQDDGRGVDLDAVRRAAQRRGLLPGGGANLGAAELLQELLKGGISTSGTVTDVSGRGIGLDVVREAASRLGGSVVVHTEKHRGTTIELVVPLSLSGLAALVVEAGGQAVAIPLDAVRRTLRVGAGDLARVAEGQAILLDGKLIPFAPLSRALGASEADRPSWSALLLEAGGAQAAIGVDRLRGVENIVMRPLPALAVADPVVAGASLDVEGNPQIVLDAERLVSAVRRADAAAAVPAVSRPTVLIIDDSLTTRMMEESILQSAGYQVEVAASAEEGIEKAGRKPYQLFLVDVEMPGMDGFGFIEHARADPQLRDIPAILVTSRASPADRRRGAEVGARAYIVKSEFDQVELLDRIRRLVG